MVILEKPYVSDLLLKTIKALGVGVLNNETARRLGVEEQYLLNERIFINRYKAEAQVPLYTNSEDAIPWIQTNLAFSNLPAQIDVFKDKVKFRNLLRPLYSDFWYQKVLAQDLPHLNFAELPLPFILKPATGFLSLGVFKVSNRREWEAALARILELLSANKKQNQYPDAVVNFKTFILEEYLEGEEYALDAYFNDAGRPVILNILKHVFSSAADVRDRLYITSKEILEENLARFQEFLNRIGKLVALRNLPLHIEVRVGKAGEIFPIEFNPLRFAGWCTTDLAYYAYGINVYEYFWRQWEPDWQRSLKDKEGKVFSIVVGDVPAPQGQVRRVDYERFAASFSRPLAIRKIDYRKYGLFAFAFIETDGNELSELDWILQTDFREFLAIEEFS